MLAEKMTGI